MGARSPFIHPQRHSAWEAFSQQAPTYAADTYNTAACRGGAAGLLQAPNDRHESQEQARLHAVPFAAQQDPHSHQEWEQCSSCCRAGRLLPLGAVALQIPQETAMGETAGHGHGHAAEAGLTSKLERVSMDKKHQQNSWQ